MNLFETSLKFNGYRIDEAKAKLNEIQQISESDFKNYVFKMREEIVKYHFQNTPFYKVFLGTENLAWEDIPVLTKSHLQQPLENRLSEKFLKKSIYIGKTSGSSGTPFIFAKDKYCHALSWAEFIASYEKYGIDLNTSLQARFYGIPLNFFGYYKERIKDFLSQRYRFNVFDLSTGKMERILNLFKSKKFDYINGYTSAIVQFAKFLKEKRITLTQVCPTLKYCIVTSEMLFDADKLLMEEVFGVPIINEYGASELGLIAITNFNDVLKVNSSSLFVEILDEAGNTVPLGKPGRIVITSLYNKAHPMIRYDIGDLGVLAASSNYKTPILEKLIGRTNDVAVLPSGKTVPGLTFYYVTKSVIADDGNVKEFTIEQIKKDTFKILYVANKELETREKLEIEKSITAYLEAGLTLIFERTAILKRSNSGKLKQFISLVN